MNGDDYPRRTFLMHSTAATVPIELQSFCSGCSEVLPTLCDDTGRIEYVMKEMRGVLLNKSLFVELMNGIVQGTGYPDARRPTMFDNELLLYSDAGGVFSLRLYLWGPGEYTYPHDHNSWGVLGTVTDGFEVINYRREDDGEREGYALLTEMERFTLRPGETTFTRPLDAGIHTTGNPGKVTAITLNLYGKSNQRGYLQNFDIKEDRVHRVYPPRQKKIMLAANAMDHLKGAAG